MTFLESIKNTFKGLGNTRENTQRSNTTQNKVIPFTNSQKSGFDSFEEDIEEIDIDTPANLKKSKNIETGGDLLQEIKDKTVSKHEEVLENGSFSAMSSRVMN